jgi:NitT/TauT family transport system ATP-binding protein
MLMDAAEKKWPRGAKALPPEPIIDITDVVKVYEGNLSSDLLALDRVTLQVRYGDLLGIVGPSGCGKSTLLNLIAGLDTFSSGKIVVEGTQVYGARKIGYVFQRETLLPWRNVRRNAEFALEIKGKPARERWRIAEPWLAKLGLAGFEYHYPHQLSGGMRKRLQLASILVAEPSILLMDEPFGALDAQTRTVIEDDFLRLWRESGITVVFVTHDLAEAIAMCTRVVIMTARPGRIKIEYDIGLPLDMSTTERRLQPQFQTLFGCILAKKLNGQGLNGDRAHRAAETDALL